MTEIHEVLEKEVEYLCPYKKSTRSLIKPNAKNLDFPAPKFNHILKLERNNLILIYIENKIFFYNQSNLKSITSNEEPEDYFVLEYDKEIYKVEVEDREEWMLIAFKDQLTMLVNLSQIITKKFQCDKEAYTNPSQALKLKNNIKDIFLTRGRDGNIYIIILSQAEGTKHTLSLYDSKLVKLGKPIEDIYFINTFKVNEQIFLVYSKTNSIGQITFSIIESSSIRDIKSFDLQKRLGSWVKLNHFAQLTNKIFCFGAFVKSDEKEETYQQNLYFMEIDMAKNKFEIIKLFTSECVFFDNDEINFKEPPTFKSCYCSKSNVFLVASSHYHIAEIFLLEEDLNNETEISKVELEDDKKIFVPKIPDTEVMSVFAGINYIDFKFDSYTDDKVMINSISYYAPILCLCVNHLGTVLCYYLTDSRDEGCKLKEKPNDKIQMPRNKIKVSMNDTNVKLESPRLSGIAFGNSLSTGNYLINNTNNKYQPVSKENKPQKEEPSNVSIFNKKEVEASSTSKTLDNISKLPDPKVTEAEIKQKFKDKIIQNLRQRTEASNKIINMSSIYETKKKIEEMENKLKGIESTTQTFFSELEPYIKENYSGKSKEIKSSLLPIWDIVADFSRRKDAVVKSLREFSHREDLDVSTLLDSEDVKSVLSDNVIEINEKLKYTFPILKAKLFGFNTFVSDMREFNQRVSQINNLRNEIKSKTKYSGVFAKFKTSQDTNSNLAKYEHVNQNLIYESVMKKIEEFFIYLDFKFEKEIKPKLAKNLRKSKGKIDGNRTYNHKRIKVNNILMQITPRVNVVEDDAPEMDMERFLIGEPKKSGIALNQKDNINLHSINHLEEMLNGVKKKIAERENEDKLRREKEERESLSNQKKKSMEAIIQSQPLQTNNNIKLFTIGKKKDDTPNEAKKEVVSETNDPSAMNKDQGVFGLKACEVTNGKLEQKLPEEKSSNIFGSKTQIKQEGSLSSSSQPVTNLFSSINNQSKDKGIFTIPAQHAKSQEIGTKIETSKPQETTKEDKPIGKPSITNPSLFTNNVFTSNDKPTDSKTASTLTNTLLNPVVSTPKKGEGEKKAPGNQEPNKKEANVTEFGNFTITDNKQSQNNQTILTFPKTQNEKKETPAQPSTQSNLNFGNVNTKFGQTGSILYPLKQITTQPILTQPLQASSQPQTFHNQMQTGFGAKQDLSKSNPMMTAYGSSTMPKFAVQPQAGMGFSGFSSGTTGGSGFSNISSTNSFFSSGNTNPTSTATGTGGFTLSASTNNQSVNPVNQNSAELLPRPNPKFQNDYDVFR